MIIPVKELAKIPHVNEFYSAADRIYNPVFGDAALKVTPTEMEARNEAVTDHIMMKMYPTGPSFLYVTSTK